VREAMERTYSPGEIIIKEGERDRAVYLLRSGKLGVLKGGRLVAEIEKPGSLFGEMSIIRNQPRSATVKALTPCVAEVYVGGINELARDQPHIIEIILRTLAERLAETTARLHSHMFGQGEDEIAASKTPLPSFKDLASVHDQVIQSVISAIGNDDLVAALLGAVPEVRDKFFRNMSEQKVKMIKEDMRIAIGICTLSSIESAQDRVLETVSELINTQKI
jgi:signal-transduction protein with cAMP-binding, CBS, and nucleotidyltransferase domain